MKKAIAALLVAMLGSSLAVGAAGADQPTTTTVVEKVCPQGGAWTSHLSANQQKTYTYTAPTGFAVAEVCVKAGSVQQGNGPEFLIYNPPQTSVTFDHKSGKEISHFSIRLVPVATTTTTSTTTTTESTTTTVDGTTTTTEGTTTTVDGTTTTLDSSTTSDTTATTIELGTGHSIERTTTTPIETGSLPETGVDIGLLALAGWTVAVGLLLVLLTERKKRS